MRAALLLAVCLLAGSACAAVTVTPAVCSTSTTTMAGGWSAITDDTDVSEIMGTVANDFQAKYGNFSSFVTTLGFTNPEAAAYAAYAANITSAMAGCATPDAWNVSVSGCSQVVAGTNYKLWVNMTCGDWTLGLAVDAFVPLPSTNATANATAIQIYDLDLEFISGPGVMINDDDINDVDDEEKWVFDATTGTFTDNPLWTDDDNDFDDNDVDDVLDDGINDMDDGISDMDDGINDNMDDGINDNDLDDGPMDTDDNN